jgi:hypothetical protein
MIKIALMFWMTQIKPKKEIWRTMCLSGPMCSSSPACGLANKKDSLQVLLLGCWKKNNKKRPQNCMLGKEEILMKRKTS